MYITAASEAGDAGKLNEDWFLVQPGIVVVLDGATARTGTGCRHGIAWYAATLGTSIANHATDLAVPLRQVLHKSITSTADRHRECDLSHPATPSAAVAIVRVNDQALEYLILGDVTVVLETEDGASAICDDRVEHTAVAERHAAAILPFGTAEKQAALLVMKHAELSLRNRDNGYWIAAADPAVAEHAIIGGVPLTSVGRYAVLTDGAARLAVPFEVISWAGLLDLLEQKGPRHLIETLRQNENLDNSGELWPRNKRSDDATAILTQGMLHRSHR
jgi:hypothetical protein